MAALAGRVRVPGLRTRRWLAAGRRPVPVPVVQVVHLGDGGHDLRPDAHAADRVVYRLLAVRHPEGRHLGAEPAAGAGDQLVPDGLGDAAPAALGARAPGAGPSDAASVEVDETYIGGEEPGLRGGRAKGKKALVGIAVEVREPKGLGRCRMASWPTRSAASLHPFVTDHVEPGATVITDAWQGYRGINELGYTRDRRSQRAARLRGEDPGELLPGVHRVAVVGQTVAPGHPPGFGRRRAPAELPRRVRVPVQPSPSRSRGLVFYRVLELAVGHEPVRYHDLILNPRPKMHPPAGRAGWGHPRTLDRPLAGRPWRAA